MIYSITFSLPSIYKLYQLELSIFFILRTLNKGVNMKRYLARLRELTLLIVEDDDFQRMTLIKIINKIGVTNVIGASNGEEAL